MRVLIVDDSQAMRRLERDVLGEVEDVEIVEAEDGAAAIYKMRDLDFQVDLILVDWVMPRMDGLALVRHLKSTPNLRRIPVLMVTSISDEAKMREAWSAGVDGYILKPFTKEIFLRSILSLSSGGVGVDLEPADDGKSDGKSFLHELPTEMRNRIVDMSAVLDVEQGSLVLRQGEVLGYFYFVAEGNVEERQPASGGVGEAVRTYGPGECLGVTELMAGDPLRSDFFAAEKSRVGRLPQVVFVGMLEKFPKIGITLSRCLASKARQLEVQGSEESSHVSGRLEILDLPTLIQAISLRQKTCVIELTELEAEIAFVSGTVHSARTGGCSGEDAFCRILAQNPTNFKIVVKPIEGERNVHASTTNLLLRSAQQIDEKESLVTPQSGEGHAAPRYVFMSYGDDRIDDFLIESHENLDGLDREILALEKDPTLAGAIGRIFRTIHTIKGTCGFFGFSKLEAITHAGEDLLSLVRDRKVDVDRDVAAALYSLVDAVRAILGSIEQSRTEGDADHAKLLETLLALQGRAAASSGPFGKHEGAGGARESPPREASPDQQPATPGIADTTLRVNVTLLDGLMNLVGELVLARNQILQLTAPLESRPLLAASQRLDLITSELQEEVTKTRLQPLSILWTRYPRLVRDVALACGKEVRLELEGEETELDKSILEALKAPLTHLLRNAIDHGIEPPEERLAAGKPREGRLSITAHHESGQVSLEISDDGSGMDASLIRRKSIERGIVTPQAAQALSDEDVIGFVFLPGFSTAETVTSVSGRGVGLDIVKTSMERVGGTVHLSTRRGTGTTFRITLPLTLAIIPALIVTTGGERYAIPQACLLEVVRLVGEAARKRVEWIDSAPVYRLRGKLIPLIFLNEELGLQEPGPSDREDSSVTIVVVEAEETRFGLVVDRVNDTEEIVVKPLGRRLKSFSVFAGATILGDGKVALILDPPSLAQRAGLELLQGTKSAAHRSSRDEKVERSRHLLVRSPGGRRLILPLGCVERLEEFPREEIETARGRPAVQYRGGVLPLVQVRDLLGDPHEGPPEPDPLEAASLQVVVHRRGESRIGLIVGSVLDIVDDGAEVTGFADGHGPPGIRVIGGRVTEVLDIESLIPEEGESMPAGKQREETHAR